MIGSSGYCKAPTAGDIVAARIAGSFYDFVRLGFTTIFTILAASSCLIFFILAGIYVDGEPWFVYLAWVSFAMAVGPHIGIGLIDHIKGWLRGVKRDVFSEKMYRVSLMLLYLHSKKGRTPHRDEIHNELTLLVDGKDKLANEFRHTFNDGQEWLRYMDLKWVIVHQKESGRIEDVYPGPGTGCQEAEGIKLSASGMALAEQCWNEATVVEREILSRISGITTNMSELQFYEYYQAVSEGREYAAAKNTGSGLPVPLSSNTGRNKSGRDDNRPIASPLDDFNRRNEKS